MARKRNVLDLVCHPRFVVVSGSDHLRNGGTGGPECGLLQEARGVGVLAESRVIIGREHVPLGQLFGHRQTLESPTVRRCQGRHERTRGHLPFLSVVGARHGGRYSGADVGQGKRAQNCRGSNGYARWGRRIWSIDGDGVSGSLWADVMARQGGSSGGKKKKNCSTYHGRIGVNVSN